MAEVRRFGTILLAILIGYALAGPLLGGASDLSTDPSVALAASIVAAAIGGGIMFIVRRTRSPLVLDMVGVATGALALVQALFGQVHNPVSVDVVIAYESIGIAVVAFAVPWRPITHYVFVAMAIPFTLVGLSLVPETPERNALAGALAFAVVMSLMGKRITWGMRVRMHRQLVQMRALNAELDHLARRDVTTGLLSRGAMTDHLARLARRPGGTVGFAMVDIDDFKAINDTFGHQAGDEVLERVAAAILSSIRAGDLAFRYGGEEFMIVLDRADPASLARAGERLRSAVEHERLPNPGSPLGFITVSIGMAYAQLPGDSALLREAIAEADAQLYAVKKSGKNAVAVAPTRTPLVSISTRG